MPIHASPLQKTPASAQHALCQIRPSTSNIARALPNPNGGSNRRPSSHFDRNSVASPIGYYVYQACQLSIQPLGTKDLKVAEGGARVQRLAADHGNRYNAGFHCGCRSNLELLMTKLRAVLFDLDGTLIDTTGLILGCFDHTW